MLCDHHKALDYEQLHVVNIHLLCGIISTLMISQSKVIQLCMYMYSMHNRHNDLIAAD